jgi:ribosomal protein S18 acetylase RimI-like enzyme
MSTQRTLNDSDYTRCHQLLLDVFGQSELQQFIEAWQARSKTASFAVVSTDNKEVVGYILVDIYNKIQYLCVDPVFRNARLGSTLLQHSLDHLKKIGAKDITLTTAKDARLTSWYAKFGFVVVKNLYDSNGDFLEQI